MCPVHLFELKFEEKQGWFFFWSSLNVVGQTFSAASGLLGFLSGWYLRASFRYVFLMSSAVAVFGKPSVWYNVSPAVLEGRTETVFSTYLFCSRITNYKGGWNGYSFMYALGSRIFGTTDIGILYENYLVRPGVSSGPLSIILLNTRVFTTSAVGINSSPPQYIWAHRFLSEKIP